MKGRRNLNEEGERIYRFYYWTIYTAYTAEGVEMFGRLEGFGKFEGVEGLEGADATYMAAIYTYIVIWLEHHGKLGV